MMLFTIVPLCMIGWTIMPIGTAITLWVLFKKIKSDSFTPLILPEVVRALNQRD